MGLCASAEPSETSGDGPSVVTATAARTSNAVDEQNEYDKAKAALRFKVLCLGAGESGKSTVIKQLKLIHNGAMSDADTRSFTSVLHENTLQSMGAILKAAARFEIKIEGEAESKAAERVSHAATTEKMIEEYIMPVELAEDIYTLWNCQSVKEVYARKSEFWILDGAEYYFERIKAATAPGFMPTEEDVIMARARTTGLVTTDILADELTWSVIDVGGQRSERKKWINCFDDVKAVLFVVNLAGYNSVLFEDERKNRMQEAIELFHQVSEEKAFQETPLFLFFNKKDLFEQQLQKTSLKVCFPEYDGKEGKEADTTEAIAYITKQFLAKLPATRTGPPVETWPIAARHKKDVQYSFQELRERLVTQNKATIKKSLTTVHQMEEKRKARAEADAAKKK